MNRRRWSNDLRDSLISYQSKEGSELVDSLESNSRSAACVDSLEENCTDIRSVLASLNLVSPRQSVNTEEAGETNSGLNVINSDSKNELENGRSQCDVLNISMMESEDHSKANSTNDFTLNIGICGNEENGSTTISSASLNNALNFNERLLQTVDLSSNSSSVKLASCSSNSQKTWETQSSQAFQYSSALSLNERLVDNNTLSSDLGNIKSSSCDSSSYKTAESASIHSLQSQCPPSNLHIDQNLQSFLSIPNNSTQGNEIIAEVNEPDVWDALLALEQALSPLGDENNEEHPPNHAILLNRLSQKFKETPTRFTEKLVSIIEDSIVSSESPTKHTAGNTSGISLHRMTGEFRKLCKFIEDESMPDLAPSLMNMTSLDKTETPDNANANNIFTSSSVRTPKNVFRNMNDTPTHKSTPLALRNFFTPKNKTGSRFNSPINRFTPTADKSFEYWETVCNLMCERPNSAKKKMYNTPETAAKRSMDEMLTICERQMASLDDSAVEIRNSEPCKKTDSDLRLKVFQVQRSKSVSKMFSKPTEEVKIHHDRSERFTAREKLFFDNEDDDDPNLLMLDDTVEMENKSAEVEKSLELLNCEGPNINQEDRREIDLVNLDENIHSDGDTSEEFSREKLEKLPSPQEPLKANSYSDGDQDCTFLIELAQRRQRCLDTAKLMMELDRDPASNEDNKCLETLYKLGIQDKTFAEVDNDKKFLSTLNHCLEYKNYFQDKSKPIINMLQQLNSPNDLKNAASSMLRSKNMLDPSRTLNTRCNQVSTKNKSNFESKNQLKKVQDRIMTPRLGSKTLSVAVLKSDKKPSNFSNLQKARVTPRVIKKISPVLQLQKETVTPRMTSKSMNKITPQVHKKSLQSQLQPAKVTSTSTLKVAEKTPEVDHNKLVQVNKLSPRVTPKLTPKVTPKITPKVNSKVTPKPLTQRTVLSPVNNNTSNMSPAFSHKNDRKVITNFSPKVKLFVSPGQSPSTAVLGRKKPSTYFSDVASRKMTPQKISYNTVKSPIGLYINGTDAELIQNVQGRINDRLLTPVSQGQCGMSPKLKFNLSSKENKSPSNQNIVLPTVRYQSAQKVRLIDDKSSHSPGKITPSSKIGKLLGPSENTIVIKHEGRVLEYSPENNLPNPEISIHVQKVAEKTPTMRKKL